MATIVIGNRECEARKLALAPHEVAYICRCSERDARNMLRRGERYQRQGLSAEHIVERGALPVTRIGGRRRADVAGVARALADDQLALAVLAALVERRDAAPRAASPDEPAPDMLASLSCL
jgi:hypothetical protein